jgi:hypothetical protein
MNSTQKNNQDRPTDGRTPFSPTRTTHELPDQETAAMLGISLDLATARVVLAALSWLVAEDGSKTRSVTGQMLRGVTIAASQPIVRYGVEEPAPHPDLPRTGWSEGTVVLRRLAITAADITSYWRQSRDRADDSCLPVEWILQFVPAFFWPAIAIFIAWGPDEAYVRMRQATITMATQTTTRTRRRRAAGQPLAANTLRGRVTAAWKLMDCLVSLRTHLAACPTPSLDRDLVEAWTHKPKRVDPIDCGARESDQDNSGPPLDDCIAQLKQLAQELQDTRSDRRYYALRRVVLLSLLVLHGSRVDALRSTRVEDYLPDFVFADGTRQPALRIYPGKTWPDDQPHYLALPNQLAQWLEDWIAAAGHTIGQADVPLFPPRRARQGQEDRFMTQAGFYSAIAGDPRNERPGTRALLPRGTDPCLGWHPHAFRHTSYQLAMRAGTRLKHDHGDEFAHIHAEEFAKALAGHTLTSTVSATYRDVTRQHLARAIVEPMWQLLWGDGLARKGLDTTIIHQLRTQAEALRLAITALDEEARQLTARAERGSAQADRLRDHERKLELLLQATQHHHLATAKRHEHDHYQRELERVEARVNEARETHIELPADLTDSAYQRNLAEALGEPQQLTSTPGIALADEITTRDFAEVTDTTEQTINRWHREGPPQNRPSPWLPGSDPWHVYTKKDKRIRVEAIDQGHLTDTQKQRLEYVRHHRAQDDASRQ